MLIHIPNSLVTALESVLTRADLKTDDERAVVKAVRAEIEREKKLGGWQQYLRERAAAQAPDPRSEPTAGGTPADGHDE